MAPLATHRLRPYLHTLLLTCGALLSLLCFDALLFRTSFYTQRVEPESSTGMFELTLDREQRRKFAGPHRVLVLGDSRMVEGFSAKWATAAAGPGWQFASAAVPGATQRDWWYMVRELDPTATRYQFLAVPMDDYTDEDSWENVANREADLHSLIGRLRWADVPDFANSFPDPAVRRKALWGSILKGLVYQQDLLHYLEHTNGRAKKVRFWRDEFFPGLDNYTGADVSVAGLQVDWPHKKIVLPPGKNEPTQNTLRNLLSEVAPQEGRVRRYRERWMGRILQHYAQSGARIVLFRVPKTPVIVPAKLTIAPDAFIHQAQRHPNVTALDEHLFDRLQTPEHFFDGMHMNAVGRREFTLMLAKEIQSTLSPPESAR